MTMPSTWGSALVPSVVLRPRSVSRCTVALQELRRIDEERVLDHLAAHHGVGMDAEHIHERGTAEEADVVLAQARRRIFDELLGEARLVGHHVLAAGEALERPRHVA